MDALDRIMTAAPVIPVLVIDNVDEALVIGEALVAGGLPVLEVTLRTPQALDAIRAMKSIPGAIVGAGTVLSPDLLDQAVEAGAEFAVSPGLTERLGKAAAALSVPLLPGVANASDIMRALDLGFSRLKFFPAMTSGGLPALKGLSSVFRQVKFCPTGGITPGNAAEWLALDAVACVGGTWLVPSGEPADRAAIETRARAAASLKPSAT